MSRSLTATSSQHLEINTAVVTAAGFTMGCWFKTTSTITDQVLIGIANKDQHADFFYLEARGTSSGDPLRFSTRQGSGDTTYFYTETTTGYTVNTWHMAVAVSHASNDRRVFIDSGSKGTDTGNTTPDNLNRTSLGRAGDASPGGYFDGLIAHPFFYNYAISDAEVAALFAVKHPLLFNPGALAAYWPLMANDKSLIGGYNLTAYNAPTFSEEPPTYRPRSPIITEHTIGDPPAPGVTVNCATSLHPLTPLKGVA